MCSHLARRVPTAAPPTGSQVVMRTERPPWLSGIGVVVGPDQVWFPDPGSVFVAFRTGLTRLIDVADLMIVGVLAEGGED